MTETQHYPDANDVLMGGGGYPAIKFDELRVWKGGTIVAKPTTRQETEFGTGKPKTYPRSGDPIMGVLVDVQTDQRLDAEDDGIRRMYVEGKRLKDAVRDGVTASGATGLEAGGQLFIAWVGQEQGQGATPAKVYEARYYPPTTPVPSHNNGAQAMPDPRGGQAAQAPAAMDDPRSGLNVFGQPVTPPPAFAQEPPAPQAAPPAPMAEPGVQSPAQAPQAQSSNDPTPEAIAALRAAGLDPQAVFPGYVG